MREFYDSIPSLRLRAFFLVAASCGLRLGEILSLRIGSDVDFEKRMLTPDNHNGQTKCSWVSFYNEEAEKVLVEYLGSMTSLQKKSGKLFPISSRDFKEEWVNAKIKTGIGLKVKDLRDWFCCEMGRLGVQDKYVDAFCGRVPQSVLARHYTDYSPERLKEIYDKANLRVFV